MDVTRRDFVKASAIAAAMAAAGGSLYRRHAPANPMRGGKARAMRKRILQYVVSAAAAAACLSRRKMGRSRLLPAIPTTNRIAV